MPTDEIVEETRRLRDEYAAQHGYNVHAIIEDLKQWEKLGFPLPEGIKTAESLPAPSTPA